MGKQFTVSYVDLPALNKETHTKNSNNNICPWTNSLNRKQKKFIKVNMFELMAYYFR